MEYAGAAWERAMTLQESDVKSVERRAATGFGRRILLGMSPLRAAPGGGSGMSGTAYDGCWINRRRVPSIRRAWRVAEVARVLRLYRELYRGFNGRHFHQIARREQWGSAVVRAIVKQGRLADRRPVEEGPGTGAAPAARREPPRVLRGDLHIDDSPAPSGWPAARGDVRPDRGPGRCDQARALCPVVAERNGPGDHDGVRDVVIAHGLPMALYTDRAHWAFHTPTRKARSIGID